MYMVILIEFRTAVLVRAYAPGDPRPVYTAGYRETFGGPGRAEPAYKTGQPGRIPSCFRATLVVT